MSRRLVTVAVAALAVVAGLTSPLSATGAEPEVPEALSSYVVTLRADDLAAASVASVAEQLTSISGGQVTTTYSRVLTGFAARLSVSAVALLRRDPRVETVRPDLVARVADTEPQAVWGLDRSDQRSLPLDGSFTYPSRAGRGTHVYVVDTGLAAGHAEFSGRVGSSRNFVRPLPFLTADPNDWADCNGHGTHVASTAVGDRWGVAKQATVHGLRVLDCSGSGANSDVIAALDWVAANHQPGSVVNLSLSSGNDPNLDTAVQSLVAQDVAVVAAAGNSNSDACGASPAAAPAALTVGATSRADARSSFSNTGGCLDLFAPGSEITAANYASTSGSTVISGTSMASPHVAGAMALLRASHPALSAEQAQARLVAQATPGVVTDAGPSSPNRLLYVVPGDQAPVARFRARCHRLRCTFDASRSTDDQGIRGYRWSFPGGRVKYGRVVSRTFVRPGWKRVVLRVTDTERQRTYLTKKIRVTRRR